MIKISTIKRLVAVLLISFFITSYMLNTALTVYGSNINEKYYYKFEVVQTGNFNINVRIKTFEIENKTGELNIYNSSMKSVYKSDINFDLIDINIQFVSESVGMYYLCIENKDNSELINTDMYCIIISEGLVCAPCLSPKRLGHVNGDDKITAFDGKLIICEFAKLRKLNIEQRIIADVNRDVKVNTKDARLVLKYSAKLISSFFVKK